MMKKFEKITNLERRGTFLSFSCVLQNLANGETAGPVGSRE
jgi:hypothetical protein